MFFWFFRYFYVIFLLISLVLDFEIFLFSFNFINIHLLFGLISIFKDYIHQLELKLLFIFLGRVFILILSNILIEVFF